MLEQLTEAEKAAYRALVRVVLATPRAVTAEIADESGLGLSEYIALETLSEAPGCQMRMAELATACGVSLSGMSRIVNRLDREGLIRRTTFPGDGRGVVAMLTAAGHVGLKQAQPAHVTIVRRHICTHLDNVDLASFATKMDRIADSLLNAGMMARRPTDCDLVRD